MLDLEPIRATKAEMTTFHGRLNAAMKARGLSQAALARKLDMHRQTINKWCRDDTQNMTLANLFAVADALQCSARWLALGGTNSPVRSVRLDPDEDAVVELYRNLGKLDPETRDSWITSGQKYLKLAPPSKANPFPVKVKP